MTEFVRQLVLRAGPDIRPRITPNGTVLELKKQPRSVSVAADEHPFQVVLLPPASGESTPRLGVISDSHVMNTEDRDTYEEDNSEWGLLNDERTTGAFTFGNIGDKIWLELKFDEDQVIIAIEVRTGPVGPGHLWDEYPDPISINVDDPTRPYQEFYNQIIAEITDYEEDPRPGFSVTIGVGDSAEKRQVTQLLFTNLMMTTAHTNADADEPNLPLLVAVPWSRPGTTVDGLANLIEADDDMMTPYALGPLATNAPHPFKISVASPAVGEGASGHDRLVVELDSWLVKRVRAYDVVAGDTKVTITGLGEPFEVPETVDTTGIAVWLEATISSGTISSVEVKHGDGAWDDYPEPVQFADPGADPKVQTKSYLLLGYVMPPDAADYLHREEIKIGDDRWQIAQCVTTHLIISEGCYAGDTVLLFRPWHAPGIAGL